MDEFEQMAEDLEAAQEKRYSVSLRKKIDLFEQAHEIAIFETIKTFRHSSKTYDPLNPR